LIYHSDDVTNTRVELPLKVLNRFIIDLSSHVILFKPTGGSRVWEVDGKAQALVGPGLAMPLHAIHGGT